MLRLTEAQIKLLKTNKLLFDTYNGGLEMIDSSWIRIVGNKNIYQNSGILRTDGTLQVGDNGRYLNANSSNITFGVHILPKINNTYNLGSSSQKLANIYATNFKGNADSATIWQTARTLTIGNKGKSVNGSINVSWTLAEIGAVNKAGDSMSGALTLRSNAYSYHVDHTSYGLHCNNSDIVGINGIYFGDLCDDFGEGIHFYRTSTTWDTLIAKNGVFYFAQNHDNQTLTFSANNAAILRAGQLELIYNSGTWINSANGKSAINIDSGSFTGWISGYTKNGRFAIATYPAQTDILYFGYMSNDQISAGINTYNNSMQYNGSTGTLSVTSVYATTFYGNIAWSNITGKPSSFTPSSHKQAWTAAECTSFTDDNNTLGVTPAAAKKAAVTFALPLTGGAMTGSISTNMGGRNAIAIGFYPGNVDGTGIAIGAGGRTIIGSGESAQSLRTALGTAAANEADEQMYITGDSKVTIFTNCQTIANRKAFTFGTDGNLTAVKFTGSLNGTATKAIGDQYGNNLNNNYLKDYVQTVDLTSLNVNTWYPVTAHIPNYGMHRLACVCQLDTGTKPSWASHDGGFTAVVEILTIAGGWATTNSSAICLCNYQAFLASGQAKPVGYKQFRNSSSGCFYLRGGAKYHLKTDWFGPWDIHTSSSTISSETVAPVTAYPDINITKSTAIVDITGSAGSVAWRNVTGKPSTFAPSSHTHSYLPLSGGTMTGPIIRDNQKGTTDQDNEGLLIGSAAVSPYTGIYAGNGDAGASTLGTDGKANLFIKSWNGVGFVDGCSHKGMTVGINCRTGTIYANKVYGAVWNDYAEFRKTVSNARPGQCVVEQGDGTLILCQDRLLPGCEIVSDTFGFAIGETNECKTPIAATGRVLAYPYEDRDSYRPGDAVCSAPGGCVSRMTREEIITYPERIIGTVSEIPNYEIWGSGNVKVDGRIWIRIR